jgi:hypothetical protein
MKQIGTAMNNYAAINSENDAAFPAIAWEIGPTSFNFSSGAMTTVDNADGSVSSGNGFTYGFWGSNAPTAWGTSTSNDDGQSNGWNIPINGGFSWTVQLLPYAEADDTYQRMATLSSWFGKKPFSSYVDMMKVIHKRRGDMQATHPNDEQIDQTILPWACCPSWKNKTYRTTKGQCTYRANGGRDGFTTDDGPLSWKSFNDKGTGHGFTKISDGMSKTALAWERNDAANFFDGQGPAVNFLSPATSRESRNKTPFYCGRRFSLAGYDNAGAAGNPITQFTKSEIRPSERRVRGAHVRWCCRDAGSHGDEWGVAKSVHS